MAQPVLSRLFRRFLFLLLFPTAAWAWTAGLEQAAQAVAYGRATPAQEMLVFLNNREINLLAQEGKLTDLVYASCQDQFFQLNEKFVNQAVKGTDFKVSISDAKLNPGTDTDVNVSTGNGKKLTVDDIKTVEGNYDAAVKKHFSDQKLDVPKARVDTNTDFMPHPDHTTPEEFKKIAEHINDNHGTAYTDPKAASAQAKLGTRQNISLDEASSFSSTMKDMANAKVNGANALRDEARAIRATDPGKAEMLQAQAAQYEYQAAKYHERLTKLDQKLRSQHGLPEKTGTSAVDNAAERIAKIGRNPYSARDAATVRNLHQNALQSSTDDLIDTMLKIAKKDPSRLAEVRRLVANEVRSLPMNRAGQAMARLESTAKQIQTAAKWATFKDSVKNLSGIKQMTKLSVVMTAGGALLMGHEGVQIALKDVKATDTLWDFFRNCYQHAAWEGTGIGPAFDRAQAEELARYMKEFENGANPSMVKHVTFTLLKTGVYMGQDVLIGVLYLPDTVWEYFTQEKEMEAYAAMQNDLAKVMHQMVLDRQAFDKMMTNMRKLGLHAEDVKPFLDCLCRNCGGSLGGLYNPGFKGEYGRGPCQCNGPLTIWKTPLPTQDTKTQYACFNQITKMHYDQAQDIFNKWHQQALTENANAVQEDLKAIKDAIASGKVEKDEDTARGISDQINAIKALLKPADLDYVRAMVGPHLANHAARNVEAGRMDRAIDNLDRVLNKIGTRHPQEEVSQKATKNQYEQWNKAWQDTKGKRFPAIDALVQKNQVQRAGGEIESLEYKMLKEFPRVLPPAAKDADFVALKGRVQGLQKSYAGALRDAWKNSSELQKSRDPRGAIPVLEKVLKDWEHPVDTVRSLQSQMAYDQSEVGRGDALRKRGQQSEEQGALAQAIEQYTASLAIQRDEALERKLQSLKTHLAQQQARWVQAKQLRDLAQALQQQNRLPEAIAKYRESLKLVPDARLEQYVKELELRIARPPSPAPTQVGSADGSSRSKPGFYLVDLTPYGGKKDGPTTVNGILIDRSSWLRLKHHGEDGHAAPRMQLDVSVPSVAAVTAIAVNGNLDHAHLVPQGTTITRMTVLSNDGRISFDIKAGVHMSEWNGPNKHQVAPTGSGSNYLPVFNLPRPMTVTGLRFDYVEVSASYDHEGSAPGFCLRGITLVGSGSSQSGQQAPVPAQNVAIAGTWRHSPEATWTLTPTAAGGWFAQEAGLGNASGPGHWTATGTFRIDYVTRDGAIKGFYEVRFAPDGRRAAGTVRELNGPMRSGTSNWVRLSSSGSPSVVSAPPGQPKVLFDNGNISGVYNLPTRPTTFSLNQAATITSIVNYHWNDGRGKPSTGTISLRDASGHTHGPWSTTGTSGQGGVPNASWTAKPNIHLPAGSYTVIDSDPASWSQNSGSRGAGISRVEGY